MTNNGGIRYNYARGMKGGARNSSNSRVKTLHDKTRKKTKNNNKKEQNVASEARHMELLLEALKTWRKQTYVLPTAGRSWSTISYF